ncbi:MAG: hypothetical protein CML24_12900 [Rhizobiales bacterium]|nr:hypothetical protein [Hyphomicrobiales bacterium]|tara:strand:- start:8892 stop:9149 length:258 start_codon:yes stop_codon:yes gene_type:complete
MRVPSGGPATKEREALLSYYRKRLAEFERIPAHRREAECADEGEATCRAMIAELEQRDGETNTTDQADRRLGLRGRWRRRFARRL